MNSKTFYYSPSYISLSVIDSFEGTTYETKLVKEILTEWNLRIFISCIYKEWKKERPRSLKENLLALVYNVEGLNTHITDVDILLNRYRPHICILTDVGATTKRLFIFPGYKGIEQESRNAFGGIAIIYGNKLKLSIIERDKKFLMIEISLANEQIRIGPIYVPPSTSPHFHLISKYINQSFVIFHDYNAKHTEWNFKKNNMSGNQLFQ